MIASCQIELIHCTCSAPVFSELILILMLSWLLAGMWFWAMPMHSHVSAMAAGRPFDFGCTGLGIRRSVGVSATLSSDRILHLPRTS